jgi:hypothetical protein
LPWVASFDDTCAFSVCLVFAVRSHCDLGVNARRMWKCLWAAMVI